MLAKYNLWTCGYNIETGKLTENHHEEAEEYPNYDNQLETADYNDFADNCVYAESIISVQAARNAVLSKCFEFVCKFQDAFDILYQKK